MKTFWPVLGCATLAVALLNSCETTRSTADSVASSGEVSSPASGSLRYAVGPSMEKKGVRLTYFDDSPKFREAQLRTLLPEPNFAMASSTVAFSYGITNFPLGRMTPGEHTEDIADSPQGQYVGNVVDGAPATIHHTRSFTKTLSPGTHVVLSYLVRSYGESLKHRSAYDLRLVQVGSNQPGAVPPVDLAQPMLFYSQPQGTYIGGESDNIVLDFYLVNTTIEPGGNHVRATVNGLEFVLDKWSPYLMAGLPAGENTVKLELLDANDKLMPGPYSSVTRTFVVKHVTKG